MLLCYLEINVLLQSTIQFFLNYLFYDELFNVKGNLKRHILGDHNVKVQSMKDKKTTNVLLAKNQFHHSQI